jgi:DNA-binding SARP family transcriptional activator
VWSSTVPKRPHPSKGRFSVALSTLRSLLDPGKRFETQHFLTADKESVGLQLERLSVDVETFLGEAEAGLAAAEEGRWQEAEEVLEFAESAYAGDFLEEDRYEDWSVPLREEARAAYVNVARALSERSLGRGDHDGAARYLLRLLERDPHDEGAHVRLVSTLVAARRHGEARRRYRIYAERMQELELEPAPFPAV